MRSVLRAFVLAAGLALVAGPPLAEATPSAPSSERLRVAFGEGIRVVWPEGAARPTAVLGIRAEPSDGPDAAARAAAFLAQHADVLGLGGVTLVPTTTTVGARVQAVRFAQMADGLPVHQRGATVTLDAKGVRVRAVHLDVVTADWPIPARELRRDTAIAKARAHVPGALAPSAAERVLLAGPPPHRAWRIVLPTLAPLGKVSVFVDTASGAIVAVDEESIR